MVGANVFITNNGTITGGTGLGGQANAVTSTGGTNAINFGNAADGLNGNVAVTGNLILISFVANTTVDSIITGTGSVLKNVYTTITLTGANTYTGVTNVNAGTLLVNGSIAPSFLTTIGNGATLGGDGIVGNTTVAAGGTLSPGNSIGQLDVNGNLTFQAGATYRVEVDPNNADRTDATGTAALAGTVNAQFAPGSYLAKQYTILSAQGGLGGTTFGALTTTNLSGHRAKGTYTFHFCRPGLELFRRVATRVSEVAAERRREEIARMLAGAEITNEARAAAERLIQQAA